jgi:hypothetical protein
VTSFKLTFDNVVLVVHVAAALIAFGVIIAYPLFIWVGNSIMEPRGLPIFHRVQRRIIQRLVNPGLAAVAISGIVLASELGTLGTFYVEEGIIAAIALGAITSAYLSPREAQLADIAERDLDNEGSVLSGEYETLSYQVTRVTKVASAIVLVTILVMIAHT